MRASAYFLSIKLNSNINTPAEIHQLSSSFLWFEHYYCVITQEDLKKVLTTYVSPLKKIMHTIYTITFYHLESEINEINYSSMGYCYVDDCTHTQCNKEFFKEGNARNRTNCQSTDDMYYQQGIFCTYIKIYRN